MLSDAQLSASYSVVDRLACSGQWPDGTASWLMKQIRHHQRKLNALSRLTEAGKKTKASARRSKILNGFAGHAAAMISELSAAEVKGNKLPVLTWADFECAVNSLPSNSPKAPQAEFFFKTKPNGASRKIYNPSRDTRVSQRLICDVLAAINQSCSDDFCVKGRGNQAAVARVLSLIKADSFSHVVVFDIANFFPSVQPKHVGWLKLPAEILEIIFLDDSHTSNTMEGKTQTARHGLPQGAPASAKITSALLGRELRSLCGANGKVIYVDDGIIGAQSRADAEKVAKALETRFGVLSGGPIGFSKLQTRSVTEGFEFLGYWIIKCKTDPSVSPSHAAKEKAKRKLFGKLRRKGPKLSFDDAVAISKEYASHWQPSFVHWKPCDQALRDLDDEFFSWVDDYFSGYHKKLKPVIQG